MNDHDMIIETHANVQNIKEWTVEHKQAHKDEKAARWKVLAPLYAAVIAGLSKAIFWN